MNPLGPLTVVFAACSITYELYLAQALTSVLGGTNLRYAMTIGLYITSMGFGALTLDPVVNRLRSGRQQDGPEGVAALIQRLFVIECLLMMCGLLAVPFVLWCDRLDLTLMMGSVLSGYLKVMVLHLPIVVIGILSGLELPLLMSCAKRMRDGSKDATVPPSSSSFDSGTLAWDYVGTVTGALLFPFLLLPRFGVFGVAGLVVLCNAATTLLAVVFLGRKGSQSHRIVPAAVLIAFSSLALFVFVNRVQVEQVIVDRLYIMEAAP